MLQVGSLGNLTVLLPLILLVAVALVATGASRLAAWWVAGIALCIGLTAVSKIYLYGCPLTPALRSPSGHTSLSLMVYGGTALIVGLGRPVWQRVALALGVLVLVGAIAVSRVHLGRHTALEVATGLGIGVAGLGLLAFGRQSMVTAGRVAALPLLLVAALVASFASGHELHAEAALQGMSRSLQLHCVPE
jgi:membrane-associated phospholipid phosphatase